MNRTGGFLPRYSIRNMRGCQEELKFVDLTHVLTSPTYQSLLTINHAIGATTVGALLGTNIVQGTGPNMRIGNRIVIKSLEIKGFVTADPVGDADFNTTLVWYLVLDRQCNGAVAASTDVFTDTAGIVAPLNHFVNIENSQRFAVLKKFVCPFNAQAGVSLAYNPIDCPFDYYRKNLNLVVDFDKDGAAATPVTIGQIRGNNLLFMMGFDGGSNPGVDIHWSLRLRFYG